MFFLCCQKNIEISTAILAEMSEAATETGFYKTRVCVVSGWWSQSGGGGAGRLSQTCNVPCTCSPALGGKAVQSSPLALEFV
jgi:hypothetical protein